MLKLHTFEEIVTQLSLCLTNSMKLQTSLQVGAVWCSQQLLPQLHGAQCRVTPKRDDIFFQLWAVAAGPAKLLEYKIDRTGLAKQVVKTM